MLIDTHAHLNFQAFKDDVDETIRRSLADDVWVINIGSQLETSRRAVELAERYSQGVYAAIGLHPIHAPGAAALLKNKLDPEELAAQATIEDFNVNDYRKLAQSKKIVAIGEIGLDYYWRPKTTKKLMEFKEKQKKVFLQQMDLAKELNLPIIFHCRSAHNELIEILNIRYRIPSFTKVSAGRQNTKPRGVVHCFTGNWEQAKEYLGMGLCLGFNGIIFKPIQMIDWQEIIAKTPIEKILVETDVPYLTPPQEAGKRNEPLFVKEVVKEIAKIKNLSYQEVSEITTENARNLFNI